MDPAVRAASFTDKPIEWTAHVEWFRSKLGDENVELYVAEADGLPIGQIRLEFESGEATLSFSIDRLVRGRGWSRWMITEAIKHTQRARPVIVKAFVKAENEPSRRAFARLGWSESQPAEGQILFRLPVRPGI
jgi:RimJ/RimL family protein N-acetyltransferase